MAKDRKDARQKKKGGAVRGTSYKKGKTAVPDGKSYRRFNVGDRLESSNSRNPVVSTVTTTDYEDYLNNFGGSRRSAGRTDRPRRNDARARTRGSGFRGGRSGRGGTETDAPGSQIKDVVKRQLPKKQVRITASVITAIIAGLLVYHIFQGVYVDYKTEVVTISPYLETIDVEGIAIRDEQIVSGSMSSTSVMTVKNGDKIFTGETIVNIFPSESEAEAFERAAEIDAELEKLRNMIAVSENNVKTVNLINRQLDKKMVGLNKAAEQRNMGEAAKIKSEIGYLMNKQLVAMRQTEGFDARIELLEKEREELDSRFSKDPRTITSPGSGYFADSCDGYENLLNSSMTGTLTVDQLKEIMNREVKPPEKSIGKLVNSFTWYLACPVPSIDSDYLIVGAIYTLYLPYSDNVSRGVPLQFSCLGALRRAQTAGQDCEVQLRGLCDSQERASRGRQGRYDQESPSRIGFSEGAYGLCHQDDLSQRLCHCRGTDQGKGSQHSLRHRQGGDLLAEVQRAISFAGRYGRDKGKGIV